MSCANVCLSDCGDSVANEFHTSTIRRARRWHLCCECKEPIARGEAYEYVSAKSDGMMYTMKTCASCVEIRDTFACGGYAYTELWESMQCDMFPVWRRVGPWDCLAKLTSAAAIDVCVRAFTKWSADE